MASSSLRLGASGALREMRLHLCQKSSASAGVRDFVSRHYVPLKTENPKLPFLVRECSGIAPRVWARYNFGEEKSEDLSNKSAEEVLLAVKALSQ
jgi:NADH dehydrogenase (ubiquinone) 1 alpha subcomplex subunit 2